MGIHAAQVKDHMAKNLILVSPDMEMLIAIKLILENKVSGAPVVDDNNKLVGMLSEKDCLKIAMHAGYHENWGGKVSEFMSTELITVNESDSIFDVAKLFIETPYKRFPVMDDYARLVGQISRQDVLRTIESLIKH